MNKNGFHHSHFHLIPGKIVKTGRHFEIQNGG